MTDIKQALTRAILRLTPQSSSAQIDAEILLAHVLHTSRAFLYTHPEYELKQSQDETFQQLTTKRCKGVPIAYLTGSREFWSLPLSLCEDTLIPRPETERLVELTLSLLHASSPAAILDLGTGSGAVALALASERADWQVLAVDISQAAVEMAAINAKRLSLTNTHMVCSDWFSSLPPQLFDAIVSNPPYIAEDDPHLNQGDVRFEPRRALVSGPEGLDAITYIIKHCENYLVPGGWLLLEHGHQQKQAVLGLLQQQGYEQVQCWPDWQGLDRISGGRLKTKE